MRFENPLANGLLGDYQAAPQPRPPQGGDSMRRRLQGRDMLSQSPGARPPESPAAWARPPQPPQPQAAADPAPQFASQTAFQVAEYSPEQARKYAQSALDYSLILEVEELQRELFAIRQQFELQQRDSPAQILADFQQMQKLALQHLAQEFQRKIDQTAAFYRAREGSFQAKFIYYEQQLQQAQNHITMQQNSYNALQRENQVLRQQLAEGTGAHLDGPSSNYYMKISQMLAEKEELQSKLYKSQQSLIAVQEQQQQQKQQQQQQQHQQQWQHGENAREQTLQRSLSKQSDIQQTPASMKQAQTQIQLSQSVLDQFFMENEIEQSNLIKFLVKCNVQVLALPIQLLKSQIAEYAYIITQQSQVVNLMTPEMKKMFKFDKIDKFVQLIIQKSNKFPNSTLLLRKNSVDYVVVSNLLLKNCYIETDAKAIELGANDRLQVLDVKECANLVQLEVGNRYCKISRADDCDVVYK